jgi:hypothetical protein
VKDAAGLEPKSTAVVPVNPLPVRVTLVPPRVLPETAESPVMSGVAKYVNWSAERVALVPRELTTAMSTVAPAVVPLGEAAEIDVLLFTIKDSAGVEPKSTAVVPLKPMPVMVTLVPPKMLPTVGDIELTLGEAVAGLWAIVGETE